MCRVMLLEKWTRRTVGTYQQRQVEIRAVVAKADKTSKSSLSSQIARKDQEIETLTAQRDLLIASHRAMILAVGEMGGMKAWRKFFARYQEVVDELRAMGALPSASISEFPARETEDA